MKRADKLLLKMEQRDEASLNTLPGIGKTALAEAQAARYVTATQRRSRYHDNGTLHMITLTDQGRARRTELLVERDQLGAKIAAARSAQMGSCIICDASARQGPYDTWRCNDDDCVASKTNVPADYWLALRAAMNRQEEDYEEQLEYAREHGHNCRCRECHVS